MIRFFPFSLRLFIIICFFPLIFSCGKYLFLLKKEVRKISQIRLIVFDMKSNVVFSEKDLDHNLQKKILQYPFFRSAQIVFLKTFIDGFNKNKRGIKISPFSLEDFQSLKETVLLDNTTLNYFDDSHIFFTKDLFYRSSNKDMTKALQSLPDDYFAVLMLKTHPWLQKVIGVFSVYNKNKKLLWSEKVNFVSNHIINDPLSPYLIKNFDFDNHNFIDKNSNHAKQIEKVYEKLAKKMVVSFMGSINRL